MIIQFVRFMTKLSDDNLIQVAKDRKSEYAALPGLVQKYYVKMGNPSEYGGIMIWDSSESLQAFKDSDLAKSIPIAYDVDAPLNIELFELLFPLRE